MSLVDRWEGKRRINPVTGRSEVNMGGPMYNCYVAPCPQPEDNWQPEPDMPWEKKDVYGKWEYPNLRQLAYPNEGTEDPKKNWKNITSILDDMLLDQGKPTPGWGHHPTLPEQAPGWGHHPRVKTMEWNYERDGDPGAGLGPIGTYDPRFPPQVVPLGKGW